uniref:Poly(A) RNA polymerase mitochondrial-like central palm domain-containing protein n=1 Tax=Lotharella globosa TaxID=91324 RepID=A0A7S3YR61_9EUKA
MLNECLPIRREQNIRANVLKDAKSILVAQSNNLSLFAFGSHDNGFAIKGSDLDMTVIQGRVDASKTTSKKKNVEILRGVRKRGSKHAKAARNRMRSGLYAPCFVSPQLIMARVPVLKLRHVPSRLEVDIVGGNSVAVINTSLLRTYASLNDKIVSLGRLVKWWAKGQGIGSAADGFLSSYAWILLTIFHVQRIGAIPSLQAESLITAQTAVVIDGHNCTFCEDQKKLGSIRSAARKKLESISLANLFFQFVSRMRSIPWSRVVVSVRRGCLLRRGGDSLSPPMVIEDPFELKHNLGKPKDNQFSQIMHALDLTWYSMSHGQVVDLHHHSFKNQRLPKEMVAAASALRKAKEREKKKKKKKRSKRKKSTKSSKNTSKEEEEQEDDSVGSCAARFAAASVVRSMLCPSFIDRIHTAARKHLHLTTVEGLGEDLDLQQLETLDDDEGLRLQAEEAALALSFDSPGHLLVCVLVECSPRSDRREEEDNDADKMEDHDVIVEVMQDAAPNSATSVAITARSAASMEGSNKVLIEKTETSGEPSIYHANDRQLAEIAGPRDLLAPSLSNKEKESVALVSEFVDPEFASRVYHAADAQRRAKSYRTFDEIARPNAFWKGLDDGNGLKGAISSAASALGMKAKELARTATTVYALRLGC